MKNSTSDGLSYIKRTTYIVGIQDESQVDTFLNVYRSNFFKKIKNKKVTELKHLNPNLDLCMES